MARSRVLSESLHFSANRGSNSCAYLGSAARGLSKTEVNPGAIAAKQVDAVPAFVGARRPRLGVNPDPRYFALLASTIASFDITVDPSRTEQRRKCFDMAF